MPLDRSRIKKGAFLTSTPIPPGYTVKRQPLPDDLKHFDEAAEVGRRSPCIHAEPRRDPAADQARPGELRAFVRQRQ